MVKKKEKVEYNNDSNKLLRSDAQRNLESILVAALSVFEKSGVDAPVREIAKKAGIGVGTLYRHFPERSDLIKAIVQQGVDACADAATQFSANYSAGEALALWTQRLVDLLETKRGLATALHSGHAAYKSLPEYYLKRLTPVLENLISSAAKAEEIRVKVDAQELLMAITRIATPASEGDTAQARRMVSILINGLRSHSDKSLKLGR